MGKGKGKKVITGLAALINDDESVQSEINQMFGLELSEFMLKQKLAASEKVKESLVEHNPVEIEKVKTSIDGSARIFSQECQDLFNELSEREKNQMVRAMRAHISVTDESRVAINAAFKSVVEEISQEKAKIPSKEQLAGTRIGDISSIDITKIMAHMGKTKVGITPDTTIGDLYRAFNEQKVEQGSVVGKIQHFFIGSDFNHPKPEELQQFTKFMINICTVDKIKERISGELSKQAEHSLDGVGENIVDSVGWEMKEANKSGLRKGAERIAGWVSSRFANPNPGVTAAEKISKNLASNIIQFDMALNPLTIEELEGLDRLKERVEGMKDHKATYQIASDLVGYVYEFVKSLLVPVFGNEVSMMVNEARKEHLQVMRKELGANMSEKFTAVCDSITKISDNLKYGSKQQEASRNI